MGHDLRMLLELLGCDDGAKVWVQDVEIQHWLSVSVWLVPAVL